MFAAFRHLRRLMMIARTLARHDALFILDRLGPQPRAVRLALAALGTVTIKADQGGVPGERLARALQTLGPTFIKLGQALATRPDLVGVETAKALSALQDRLPPFPAVDARRVIEQELRTPLGDCFRIFDDRAVAAASIAQVHFAETADGRAVAVKVLRPGIEEAFAHDLATFRWAALKLERHQPALRRLRPRDVVETFAETVAMELDLRYEGAAAAQLKENMTVVSGFDVPEVIWPLTGRRVLTLERVAGIPLGHRDALLAAGLDLKALAGEVVRAFLRQALYDGFFHADLHQGNLFATTDGRVVAVDFGIMGRLDPSTRRVFAEILYGFLTRDYERVADAHFRAGYVPADQSKAKFAQALRAIGDPIAHRPLKEISLADLLGQLLATTETFAMQTQPQLLLLQKTMVMVEGVAYSLDPDVNMWSLSAPVLEGWIADNLSPLTRLRDVGVSLQQLAQRLPEAVDALDRCLNTLSTEQAQAQTPPPPSAARDRAAPFLWAAVGGLVAALAVLALWGDVS